jgi:hypothetical protein
MSNVIQLDRYRPTKSNHVFEAHDAEDETATRYFDSFRDEGDTGVYLSFIEGDPREGTAVMRETMWIDADQCEQFGKALLAAAQFIREADFRESDGG